MSRRVSRPTLAAASHPGRRSNQEDASLARFFGGEAWLVVADGMGGHAAGEVASRLAVEAFAAAAPARGDDAGSRLDGAAAAANAAILAHAAAHPESDGLGSTVVAAVVRDGEAVLGHAGDSRAWLVTPDGVVQLTRDHSALQDALDRGESTSAELARSPYGHAILRCLGDAAFAGLERTPNDGAMALPEGSILLLTSDGAHGFLTPAEMLEHLAGTPSLVVGLDHLARKAYANGSDDNITLVGCEVGRFPRSRVAAQAPPPFPRLRRPPHRVPRFVPLALAGLLAALLALLGVLLSRALWLGPTRVPGQADGASATAAPTPTPSPTPAPAAARGPTILAPPRAAPRVSIPAPTPAAQQKAPQATPVPAEPTAPPGVELGAPPTTLVPAEAAAPPAAGVGSEEAPVVLRPPIDVPPVATAAPPAGGAAAPRPSAPPAASTPKRRA